MGVNMISNVSVNTYNAAVNDIGAVDKAVKETVKFKSNKPQENISLIKAKINALEGLKIGLDWDIDVIKSFKNKPKSIFQKITDYFTPPIKKAEKELHLINKTINELQHQLAHETKLQAPKESPRKQPTEEKPVNTKETPPTIQQQTSKPETSATSMKEDVVKMPEKERRELVRDNADTAFENNIRAFELIYSKSKEEIGEIIDGLYEFMTKYPDVKLKTSSESVLKEIIDKLAHHATPEEIAKLNNK